ncbi:D(5)-like dopamine receptor [Exaiptasia diaphana]|nr:D(5)-like dopamine receptor [Exaiptasia diaphana]
MFIWTLSLGVALLPFTGWRQMTKRTEGGFCQYHLNLDITYIFFLHVTVCVIPITVTCFAYCKIFRIAKEQAMKIANAEINVSERERQQLRLEKERKITLAVAVVVGVFILCWGPLNILLIVYAACHSCVSSSVVEGFEIPALINSACNPIIYSVFNKDFRQTFKRLLCCQYECCHRNSVSD